MALRDSVILVTSGWFRDSDTSLLLGRVCRESFGKWRPSRVLDSDSRTNSQMASQHRAAATSRRSAKEESPRRASVARGQRTRCVIASRVMALETSDTSRYDDSKSTEAIKNSVFSNNKDKTSGLTAARRHCRAAAVIDKSKEFPAGAKSFDGIIYPVENDRAAADDLNAPPHDQLNINNARRSSASDKTKLSYKVICARDNSNPPNDSGDRYAEIGHRFNSDASPCDNNNDTNVDPCVRESNKCSTIVSRIRNSRGMIAGDHPRDGKARSSQNESSAGGTTRNAENHCRRRDRSVTNGAKTAADDDTPRESVTRISRVCGTESSQVKMNLARDPYKNSSRGSRSCESTPETANPRTTIGRDKSPAVRPRCKLNENNCLSLRDILLSFNGPISEEQAWALCYQCAKCFKSIIQHERQTIRDHRQPLYDVNELAHVLLHKDGDVHSTTIREPVVQQDTREPFVSEQKLVFSLGLIVFGALDFGLDEEEERRVAPDLEALITTMTQPEDESEVEERLQETDDEGIERDSGESEDDPLHRTPDHPGCMRRNASPPIGPRPPAPCSVNTVLQLCTRHLQGTSEQADTHYKAVVRALVAEALELSHFLEKVAADKQGNSSSSGGGIVGEHHLDTLDFSDWARFWVQVIGELRRGVKLKKVEDSIGVGGKNSCGGGGIGTGFHTVSGKRVRGTGRGIEFELTPYEILMDDIRARRYRLRKTPSPSPHLRKDAHAVILDFIRSRPPLKKASERKLQPLKRQSTPRELLMESIKRPPRPLRPCSGRKTTDPRASESTNEQENAPHRHRDAGAENRDDTHDKDLVTTPKSSRRESADPTLAPKYQSRRLIIPVDFKLDGEDDDDDDDVATRFDDDDGTDSWKDEDEGDEDNVVVGGEKGRRAAYDLATQCPSRRAASRRHTVVGATGTGVGSGAGTSSLPQSRPQSRQNDPQNRNETAIDARTKDRSRLDPELPSSINSSQDELAREKSPNKGNDSLGNMFLDERLSLTLEEIVHIRSVLTKAELESLPVEGRVKEDVEKRRVCFLCLKTRFGILGPWGQRCRLCERTVCVRCHSKMRIPTEHFAHVPVVLLSPSLMISPPSEADGKDYSSPSHGAVRSLWPRPAGGVGSAPASPASKRRDPTSRNTTPTPTRTPLAGNNSNRDDEGATSNSLPPSNNSPAAGSTQALDKSRRFYCSSANSSPARTSSSSSRYGAGDLRVAERLRGVAMVVCHDCRILVLQIIKSSRTTRATIRNNVISRLTLNLSPIYV